MYIPRVMEESDPERIRAIITEFPFATLVTCLSEFHITHVPLLPVGERGPVRQLYGHIARANSHGDVLEAGPSIAIFQGPHGYISPRWYASEGQVPTWNYVAVHVHGTARMVTEPAEIERSLLAQVAFFEGSGAGAWRPAPEVLATKLKGITAFTIEVVRIEAKLKLGQNRALADRIAARQALEQSERPGDHELGSWMRATEPRA